MWSSPTAAAAFNASATSDESMILRCTVECALYPGKTIRLRLQVDRERFPFVCSPHILLRQSRRISCSRCPVVSAHDAPTHAQSRKTAQNPRSYPQAGAVHPRSPNRYRPSHPADSKTAPSATAQSHIPSTSPPDTAPASHDGTAAPDRKNAGPGPLRIVQHKRNQVRRSIFRGRR